MSVVRSMPVLQTYAGGSTKQFGEEAEDAKYNERVHGDVDADEDDVVDATTRQYGDRQHTKHPADDGSRHSGRYDGQVSHGEVGQHQVGTGAHPTNADQSRQHHQVARDRDDTCKRTDTNPPLDKAPYSTLALVLPMSTILSTTCR